jgi:hypothetical protein
MQVSTLGFTTEQRETFEREGFVVLPGALKPDHVERLTAAVDRIYAEKGTPGDALHLLAFAGEDELFMEMLDYPPLLAVMVELLGTNIFLHHCHLDVHPPMTGEGTKAWMWHQDGGIQNRDIESDPRPRLSAKVAYFLTDVSEPGRGNFVVLPRSHLMNRIDRPADDDNNIPGALQVLASPGDAVVFDRRTWHMRSDNHSDITRKGIFFAYTYRWIRPRDDMEIPPEMEKMVTPVRRQILGRADATIDHWMPDLVDVPIKDWWESVSGSKVDEGPARDPA